MAVYAFTVTIGTKPLTRATSIYVFNKMILSEHSNKLSKSVAYRRFNREPAATNTFL